MWTDVTSQLPVSDVKATQQYYRDVLGCEIAWLWQDSYGAVFNGKTCVYFCKEEEPVRGMVLVVGVEDADRAYEAFKGRGAKVVSELDDKPWGVREFTVEDPNGHRLRFSHGLESTREIADFETYL